SVLVYVSFSSSHVWQRVASHTLITPGTIFGDHSTHAHFHPKLIAFVRFAFADAFHLRRMHVVHFAFVFPLLIVNPLRLF
ncbi:MAG: hypothetical protein HN646_09550, partial [Nitrospina sp.]|nr:hypothetical protein [Nitrospina sp.]